jgi:hypothetical protein
MSRGRSRDRICYRPVSYVAGVCGPDLPLDAYDTNWNFAYPDSETTRTVTVPPVALPGVPANVGATATTNSATLTWSPPTDDGGSAITGYLVARDGGTSGGSPWSTTLAASARSFTFPQLTAESTYTLSVQAINSGGTGPASSQVVTTTTTPGGVRFEESAVALDGWAPDTTGTYRASKVTGNTAQFPFSGTNVKWLTKKGPTMGKASVTIDGVAKGTFDLYASTAQSSTVSFTGLASKSHTIVIKVLGTKNASATDTKVAVDGFTVGTTTTQENSVKVLYDAAWKAWNYAAASGGTYRASSVAAHTASLTFTGTSVDWITATGPGWGKAEVYIDGIDKGTVDLYATTIKYQTVKPYSGLAAGTHTITVKSLGTKNAAANSAAVNVDAFVVH